MFCPQCGQQQPSGEARFCPRCGLALTIHSALLAGDNTAAAAALYTYHGPAQPPKRAATRRGAKMMFFSVVLFPIFFGLCFLINSPVPLFVPLTVFLTGLVWLIYARLFGEELIDSHRFTAGGGLKGGGETHALGAPQFVPAPLFGRQGGRTSEIAQPPSVTEGNTTLLGQ